MPARNGSKRIALASLLALTLALMAQAATLDGRWRGKIDIPGAPLEFMVDLARQEQAYRGAITIPSQGLAGFPLADVQIDDGAVSFAMAGIPGTPRFSGSRTDDHIAGEFTQSGQTFSFSMTLTGIAELTTNDEAAPLDPALSKPFLGSWAGTLDVPGQPLRLVLHVRLESGALAASLDSPDQGQTGMPVTAVTIDGNRLRAELSYANAAFEGALDEGHGALVGAWSQGGGSMPLTLRSLANDPFPSADPESVGLAPEALERLESRVQALVDDEEIVGGELLVIKNRRTVLQRAFGWSDREAEMSST